MRKRKPLKRISDRQRLIKATDALFLKILKHERGDKCETCGRTKGIAASHILDKGRYPRLRWCKTNVLLQCWYVCHYPYHHCPHDDPRYRRVIDGIIRLRGENYRDTLLVYNKILPPMTMFQIQLYHKAFKKELEKNNHKT